jgi:predicted solute-binding protein
MLEDLELLRDYYKRIYQRALKEKVSNQHKEFKDQHQKALAKERQLKEKEVQYYYSTAPTHCLHLTHLFQQKYLLTFFESFEFFEFISANKSFESFLGKRETPRCHKTS